MNKKELGIYIHIPFCKKKCDYCDFISYSKKEKKMESYIKCLKKEIQAFDFSNYEVTTIYIGGGTPSYLESSNISEILKEISKKINIKEIEITIEINPGTVNKEKLQIYKQVGINRLSIGLQSVNNERLKEIGRIHTYEEFLETYKNAREIGFNNINIDLMIGLPNQSVKEIQEEIEEINKLNPEHISVYSLIVEEGTPIAKKIENGKITLPEEDEEREMYWSTKKLLESKGYYHYEISNFAKKGKESKHNLNCWNQEEYIGFGVAAHSYINGVRFSNTPSLEEYIQNIEKNELNKNKNIEETQNLEDKQKEYILLGLRKLDGISISKFKEKFVQNPIFLYKEIWDKLIKNELIEIDLDKIKLTNKGLDLANLVFEEFI